MAKEKKIHRKYSGSGHTMCGRGSAASTVTDMDGEVTCGLCWRSMMGSWGAEPPSWVSRNTGGRKSKSKSKRKPLPKSVSQYTFTKTKYVTVLATNLEEAEAIAKAGGGNESRFPKFDLYSSSSILPRETDDE